MKYTSVDRLNDFEFHDSEIKLVEWSKIGKLTLCAILLNVHKDAAPNNKGVDMEIKEANICFHNIRINEYELMRSSTYDEDGIEHFGEQQVVHKGDKARKMFEKDLEGEITVLYLEENNNGEYELGGIGYEYRYFMLRFTFNTVEIEWSDYSNAAWYELNQQHQCKILLSTPSGDINCDLHILSQSEEVYDDQSDVRVTLFYNEKQIEGYGKDYFWVEAFADLQKKLPDGIRLKCCLNCRHGNMCPYGNFPDQVFCTNGSEIKDKDGIISYIDKNPDWQSKARLFTDVCGAFVEQSDDYYTYNDYLYWLNKK